MCGSSPGKYPLVKVSVLSQEFSSLYCCMEKLSLKDVWGFTTGRQKESCPIGREILQGTSVELQDYPQRCEWILLDTRLVWTGTMR